MARLDDVAHAAGVSAATVSRALTRPDMVESTTRARVLAVAKELGYQHNRSARALATGRARLIGLSVPTLANPFFAPIISGAQTAAEQADNELVVVVSEGRPARERTLLGRLRGRVDGLVAVAPRGDARQIVTQARSIPLVTVNRKVRGVSSVIINTPGGLSDLGRHLKDLGHSRVAYVGGPPGSWMDRKRRHALATALGTTGREIVSLGPYQPTFAAGSASALDVLASRCTAVVAYNSVVALGLMHGLEAAGVAVPEDISLACGDDLTSVGLAVPDITAVHVPAEDAGRLAIEIMLEQLDSQAEGGEGDGPRETHRTLPVSLLEGKSTCAPR